jgi:N-methylhydantoinase A
MTGAGAGLRLGIDIGGTFTDFALVDRDGRRLAIHKQLTTPRDPALAVLSGIHAILADNGFRSEDLAEIVHGTTLVTNALIERLGARTGMLVTEGFRDLFDIGKEQRYDLFDLRLRFAEPLVPRTLRAEVPERLRHDGSVLVPLDEDRLRAAAADLVETHGIEALAICYLHSYADPVHEVRTREVVRAMYPDLYVSGSADVFPYMREFDRWTTACANAYAQPLVDRYLGNIERSLGELGVAARLWVVGSSGGLMTPETARRYPVRLLESGPAAGVLMTARLGRELDFDHVLSFDLGGTTAKGALVRRGEALRAYSFEAAHAYNYRSGSGLQLQIPVIDMKEIGAGGGSIVAVDELGRMRVGPRSAGAEPGPACYGRGGELPTLTDANLQLGYLNPDYFLGGRMRLEAEAAAVALRRLAAEPLGLDLARAAWGVHDMANEDIARAFRMHATERGFDYRRCGMVAFGGGGPIHAARIARKLGVPRVIFPAGAGVMSAFGMLAAAQSFEVVRAFPRELGRLTPEELGRALAESEGEVSAHLLAAGVPPSAVRLRRRADMRYRGQGYDIEIALPDERDPRRIVAQLPGLFSQRYRDVFHVSLDEALEIVSLKVEAVGPEPAEIATGDASRRPEGARKAPRQVFFPHAGGFVECPVYDRYGLGTGDGVSGPALIEERESTSLLDVGDVATVDPRGNLVAEIASACGGRV